VLYKIIAGWKREIFRLMTKESFSSFTFAKAGREPLNPTDAAKLCIYVSLGIPIYMPSQDRLYSQLGPSTVGNATVTVRRSDTSFRRSDEPVYIFVQLPFSSIIRIRNVESFQSFRYRGNALKSRWSCNFSSTGGGSITSHRLEYHRSTRIAPLHFTCSDNGLQRKVFGRTTIINTASSAFYSLTSCASEHNPSIRYISICRHSVAAVF
jgi:hypothetical protein